MSTNTSSSPPTVEQAIRLILQKNFDADSKICFLTLLKIIDNILQKPGNEKVRSLRTGNATIRSKILDKHGHHVLMACGFVHEPADLKWQKEERLVLCEAKEDTQILVKARHTLARIATLELGLQAGEIPPYKAPPAPVATAASSSSSSSSTPSSGFDVYSGSRYDGQSAAIGANLGAPKNWKSKTEQELESLKQREAKLQNQMAKQPSNQSSAATNRQWTVFLPGQAQAPEVAATSTSSASTTSTKGDASLLATHFKEQHAKRVAADNRGFTTKAMRDLEKLKKTKVYSHTQLAIHFPDGISVRANFSTFDKLWVVMEGLRKQVLFSTETLPLPDFELYQTPPRRVLGESETLQALGLVPAAKIYVGWKKPLAKLPQAGSAWYIRPELWNGNTLSSSSSSSSSPALPTSVPVLPTAAKGGPIGTTANATSTTAATKRKKTREEKEAALMKRMLGKR